MKTLDIKYSLDKLLQYIESEKYLGWDPFDGLSSPVFQLPVLQSSKLLRFGYQQVHRRLPFNIRPILAIKKEINPVTLGLCIQGYSYLSAFCPEKQEGYRTKIDWCLERLTELKSSGFSGACWGYNFDWESRYVRIPAFSPTVVATGFITNALYDLYQLTENKKAKELCIDSVQFVMNDLNKTWDGNSFCYSYSSLDRQIVFNATMKGARLLSQVYSITKNTKIAEEAKNTIDFVMKFQREDGSWTYSKNDARKWVDNFHTAYILDCLDTYIKLTGDSDYKSVLNKGLDYYFTNFFIDNCIPKYYGNIMFPIDSTAAAQSIITACRFNRYNLAKKIVVWMIENMQDSDGYFYYQKHRLFKNKISYMRWSNSWMFFALSYFLYKVKNDLD